MDQRGPRDRLGHIATKPCPGPGVALSCHTAGVARSQAWRRFSYPPAQRLFVDRTLLPKTVVPASPTIYHFVLSSRLASFPFSPIFPGKHRVEGKRRSEARAGSGGRYEPQPLRTRRVSAREEAETQLRPELEAAPLAPSPAGTANPSTAHAGGGDAPAFRAPSREDGGFPRGSAHHLDSRTWERTSQRHRRLLRPRAVWGRQAGVGALIVLVGS